MPNTDDSVALPRVPSPKPTQVEAHLGTCLSNVRELTPRHGTKPPTKQRTQRLLTDTRQRLRWLMSADRGADVTPEQRQIIVDITKAYKTLLESQQTTPTRRKKKTTSPRPTKK